MLAQALTHAQSSYVRLPTTRVHAFNRWLNVKDTRGNYMFNAGFLGMDNISCVDRSSPPAGTTIDQVCCLCLLLLAEVCLVLATLMHARAESVAAL